jgi:hypothetical protein
MRPLGNILLMSTLAGRYGVLNVNPAAINACCTLNKAHQCADDNIMAAILQMPPLGTTLLKSTLSGRYGSLSPAVISKAM